VDEFNTGQLYVLTARIPQTGIEKFNEYESLVLPLLKEHGAKLERRLQSHDQLIEVHLIWFPSEQSFDSYRNDPRRSQYAHILAESGASTELIRMNDCEVFY